MGRTPGYLERAGDRIEPRALKHAGLARWRLAAGIAILAALLGFCALLFQPYLQNWRLQRYLEELAFDPQRQTQGIEVTQAAVAERAARLGLPVRLDQIRVRQNPNGVFLEAAYVVRVELLLYTVDLHFRPSAGAR